MQGRQGTTITGSKLDVSLRGLQRSGEIAWKCGVRWQAKMKKPKCTEQEGSLGIEKSGKGILGGTANQATVCTA